MIETAKDKWIYWFIDNWGIELLLAFLEVSERKLSMVRNAKTSVAALIHIFSRQPFKKCLDDTDGERGHLVRVSHVTPLIVRRNLEMTLAR